MTGSWWGWGEQEAALGGEALDGLAAGLTERFGQPPPARFDPPDPERLVLPAPRLSPPDGLGLAWADDARARAAHAHGKAFRDVARNLAGAVAHPPDAVALPADADAVERLLAWAGDAGAAVVPYGAGSSVVGGVECRTDAPVVACDLSRLAGVTDVDSGDRLARIAAGTTGPRLEAALAAHGLTLRHFPQSFEFSTLGGWIATRSGGHFATGPTRIDDFVAGVEAVTPTGRAVSRVLPGSGAGPSPDALWCGSEGALGVITAGWMRVRPRPRWRGQATVRFAALDDGVACAQALAQSGLEPAGCRLLDPGEAALHAGVDDGSSVLLLAFESAFGPVDAALAQAVACAGDHGGQATVSRWGEQPEGAGGGGGGAGAGAGADAGAGAAAGAEADADAWRRTFLSAPYLRDGLVRLGCVVETLETACRWSRVGELRAAVTDGVRRAAREVCGGEAEVTMRFTHLYPDGPAPYFTVVAPGRLGPDDGPEALVAQWDELKIAASEALGTADGTITHHHAVGRDHLPWYLREVPGTHHRALAAAKRELDPGGVCNPGVLGLV